MRILVAILVGLALAASATAQELRDDAVDHLELAARLLADGNVERAVTALAAVDTEAADLDRPRFHTISGLVALRSESYAEARDAFERALRAHEQTAPTAGEEAAAEKQAAIERLHLYLAQVHAATEQWASALLALDRAGETAAVIAMVHVLRAQAHWESDDPAAAFAALDAGATRFPGDARFLRRKVFYLLDLGLHQHAADLGRAYLAESQPAVEDFVAIGGALRRSGRPNEALTILERARLLHPGDRAIAVELAHTWLDHERIATAADLFAIASAHHPELLVEAAELQRRSGHLHRALSLNAAIPDQARKFRQRLSILVEMERWDLAAGMGDALARADLLEQDDIRYAYAYSLFRSGRYQEADTMLGGIGSGETFRRAVELRRAMETCREEPWRCL